MTPEREGRDPRQDKADSGLRFDSKGKAERMLLQRIEHRFPRKCWRRTRNRPLSDIKRCQPN